MHLALELLTLLLYVAALVVCYTIALSVVRHGRSWRRVVAVSAAFAVAIPLVLLALNWVGLYSRGVSLLLALGTTALLIWRADWFLGPRPDAAPVAPAAPAADPDPQEGPR
jgi:presenilin-like A22 family membrane protease